MTEWCHEFDFAQSDGGFEAVPNPWTSQVSLWTFGTGWEGYAHPAGGPDSANQIQRSIPANAVLTRIELTAFTNGPYCDPYGCSISVYRGGSYSPGNVIRSTTPVAFEYTYTWDIDPSVTADNIGLHHYESQYPSLIFRRLKLFGTGTNPFNLDEISHQTALDTAFTALRAALQTNPSANVDTLVAAYKDAIEDAFGVTFDGESGAPDEEWGATALHFARQGLQATAEAFEKWVESELDNECIPVDRFALFRRIMGSMTFNNVEETRENFAFSNQEIITVYQRPVFIDYYVQTNNGEKTYTPTVLVDGTPVAPPSGEYEIEERPQYLSDQYEDGNMVPSGRQAIMTPNNFIHELGHSLSRFSGFGYFVIGSIENAIDTAGLPYARDGIGPSYLRVQFYEHATITENSTTHDAVFTPFNDPTSFDPTGYLLYDLMGPKYNTWNSDLYTDLYGSNARIDAFGINTEASAVETVADAFLSWVQTAFQPDSYGANWQAFFDTYMGKFLRNAVIWQIGMKTHFASIIYPPLPQRDVNPGTFQLRLAPIVDPSNSLGKAYDPNDPDNDNDLSVTRTYGWAEYDSQDWFLVEDNHDRLVWIIQDGVQFVSGEDDSLDRQIMDPLRLSPDRPYDDDDLLTIIG